MPNFFQQIALLSLFIAALPVSAEPLSIFNHDEHCVAYVAKKTLALVKTVTVVGKNCQVSAQVLPDTGERYYIEVVFETAGFTSGETERDRDVNKILKASKYPQMKFISQKLPQKEWHTLLLKEQVTIKGELFVAGNEYPISADVTRVNGKQGVDVVGVIKTKFSSLGLNPPKLAAGLAAKVREDLELHFQLLGRETLGAGSILPPSLQSAFTL